MSIPPTQFGLFICSSTVYHQALLKETLITFYVYNYICKYKAILTRKWCHQEACGLNKELSNCVFNPWSKQLNV